MTGSVVNPLLFFGDQIVNNLPALLMLVPIIGVPKLVRGLPDNRRFILFLVFLGLGPLAVSMLISVFTGGRLKGAWGMQFIPLIPVLVVGLLETQRESRAVHTSIKLGLSLMTIMICVAVLQVIASPIFLHRALRTQFPGNDVAQETLSVWRTQFPDQTLAYVTGDKWIAENVAYYSESRPSVVCAYAHDCGLDSVDLVKRVGAVVVWDQSRDGVLIPANVAKLFPEARKAMDFKTQAQTGYMDEPILVGIGLIPPGSIADSESDPGSRR